MSYLGLHNPSASSTPVPDRFLSEWMLCASGTYVKVYLYFLYLSRHGSIGQSSKDAARVLYMTESDILEAIHYWEEKGALAVDHSGDTEVLVFPELSLPVPSPRDPEHDPSRRGTTAVRPSASAAGPVSMTNSVPAANAIPTTDSVPVQNLTADSDLDPDSSTALVYSDEALLSESLHSETISAETANTEPTNTVTAKVIHIDQPPVYLPVELAQYRKDPAVQHLFALAEKCLARPLSNPVASALYSFYDYYKLPIDVVEYLIQYCTGNGQRSINYLEAVARDWSENKIDTVDKAEFQVRRFDIYRPYLREMGISRYPTDQDARVFSEWEEKYHLSQEMILEACRRAKGNAAEKNILKYTEGILKNWHNKGIKTRAQILADDQLHAKAAESQAAVRKAAASRPSRTRKNMTYYHDQNSTVDYDALGRELAVNSGYPKK